MMTDIEAEVIMKLKEVTGNMNIFYDIFYDAINSNVLSCIFQSTKRCSLLHMPWGNRGNLQKDVGFTLWND